jgi:uncharacterized protein YqfA (UPF0365 family)
MLFGVAAIVVFDAVASLASKQLGFPYMYAAAGSYILYAVGGYLAARRADMKFAAQLGAMLGLADASIGWAVSAAIGPNVPTTPPITILSWAFVAIVVVLTGVVCALIGGAIGRAKRGSAPSAT